MAEPLAAAITIIARDDRGRAAAHEAFAAVLPSLPFFALQPWQFVLTTHTENHHEIEYESPKPLDPPSIESLIADLGISDWHIRLAAVEALRNLGDSGAVEPLIAALEHRNCDVRQGAAWTLGKIGNSRAVEPLIAALGHSDSYYWPAVSAAAEALGKIGNPKAVEPLIDMLGDPDVRRNAVEALGKIGDSRAVEPLIVALTECADFSL